MELDELTKLFALLGATDPEGWARSQIEEEIPQLARFLFLRQAWREVISETDTAWIDDAIDRAQTAPREPYAGIGLALIALRRLGAKDADIVDLVRGMQATLLFRLCYLLGDPGDVEPEVEDIEWAFVLVPSSDGLLQPIAGLHESVLGTDPTGREMRPRERDATAPEVREEVVVLRDVPPPCAGAAMPAIVADEDSLTLAYFARPEDGRAERIAVVHFEPTLAHRFGTPNDETLASHPLSPRGLQIYAAHEVSPSPWLAEIVQRNSIHSGHRAEHFAKWRHFVVTFHDSTFECLAKGFTVASDAASTEVPLQRLLDTVAKARRERPNP